MLCFSAQSLRSSHVPKLVAADRFERSPCMYHASCASQSLNFTRVIRELCKGNSTLHGLPREMPENAHGALSGIREEEKEANNGRGSDTELFTSDPRRCAALFRFNRRRASNQAGRVRCLRSRGTTRSCKKARIIAGRGAHIPDPPVLDQSELFLNPLTRTPASAWHSRTKKRAVPSPQRQWSAPPSMFLHPSTARLAGYPLLRTVAFMHCSPVFQILRGSFVRCPFHNLSVTQTLRPCVSSHPRAAPLERFCPLPSRCFQEHFGFLSLWKRG